MERSGTCARAHSSPAEVQLGEHSLRKGLGRAAPAGGVELGHPGAAYTMQDERHVVASRSTSRGSVEVNPGKGSSRETIACRTQWERTPNGAATASTFTGCAGWDLGRSTRPPRKTAARRVDDHHADHDAGCEPGDSDQRSDPSAGEYVREPAVGGPRTTSIVT